VWKNYRIKYVLFFSSEESGKQWMANHEGTFLLTLEQAHQIGRLTNKATFGSVKTLLGHL
jgi:hypothetical protein